MKNIEQVEQELHTYKCYIREFVEQLKDVYKDQMKETELIKEKADKQDRVFIELECDKHFAMGEKVSYYHALEKLRSLAEGFLIPLKEIGLEEPIKVG